jgi:CRP-like cAMP-binding protein
MIIDLLRGLDPAVASEIAAMGRPMELPAGRVLFTLGETADAVFAIQRGRIALTLPMHVNGRDQDVLVEERVAGETVGWSALVPPHRFTLTATASIDSDAIAFPRTALFDRFAADPQVGLLLTRNIATVIGQRLQVLQAMWLREMQRVVQMKIAAQGAA